MNYMKHSTQDSYYPSLLTRELHHLETGSVEPISWSEVIQHFRRPGDVILAKNMRIQTIPQRILDDRIRDLALATGCSWHRDSVNEMIVFTKSTANNN